MRVRPQKLVGAAVMVGITAWILSGLYGRFYAKPVGALQDEINRLERVSKRLNDEMDGWIQVRKRLKEFGGTLISREFDQTDHLLRMSLQGIGVREGLKGVSVATSPPKAVRTPLAEARLRGRMYRTLADARDFAVIRGSFSGVGDLDQVVQTLAYLQVQPWLHRLDRVTIEPRGRERSGFELDVGFTVAFAPDLAPETAVVPVIAEPSEAELELAHEFASRNVFVRPPPPPPPAPVVKPTPPQPPPAPVGPAFDRWRVTGLVEKRRGDETIGVEAWVLNLDTGEQRVLLPGDGVLGVVLVWVSGECGLFEIDGNRVVIHQGQTLDNRAPVDAVDCPGLDGVPPGTGATNGEGET